MRSKFRTLIASAAVAICIATAAGARQRDRQAPTPGGQWQLAVGSEWTYELVFSQPGSVLYDPYFPNSPLLSSSVTHGTGKVRPSGSMVLSLKAVPPATANSVTLELNDDAKRFWFAPEIKQVRLVSVSSTDNLPENHPWRRLAPFATALVALELHGEVSFDEPTPNPWVLGQILAIVPADGKSRVEKDGWLVEPVTSPITVPAGTFNQVIHSRIPRGEAPPSPPQRSDRPAPHIVESWVARPVGLVRSVVAAPDGRVLYELRLTKYVPAQSR